jgi:hypothetical protein
VVPLRLIFVFASAGCGCGALDSLDLAAGVPALLANALAALRRPVEENHASF